MVEPQEADASAPSESGPEDPTVMMEELLDLLKLLNYERGFLSKGFKPATRAQFAIQMPNQSDQFVYFTS